MWWGNNVGTSVMGKAESNQLFQASGRGALCSVSFLQIVCCGFFSAKIYFLIMQNSPCFAPQARVSGGCRLVVPKAPVRN